MQDAQAEQDKAEMNFSSKRMTRCLSQSNESVANHTTEQLMVLKIAQSDSAEMTLEELEHA